MNHKEKFKTDGERFGEIRDHLNSLYDDLPGQGLLNDYGFKEWQIKHINFLIIEALEKYTELFRK